MEISEEKRLRIEANRQRAVELAKSKAKERELLAVAEASDSPVIIDSSFESQSAKYTCDGNFDSYTPTFNPFAVQSAAKPKEIVEDLECEQVIEGNGEDEAVVCGQPVPESNRDLWRHFEVKCCSSCSSKSTDFDLITRETVKSDYLIPAGSIALMPFMEKENPRNAGWTSMKLYLRRHAKERAMKRWGSLQALEAEKQIRRENKFQRELLSAQDFFGSAASALGKDGREEKNIGVAEKDIWSMEDDISSIFRSEGSEERGRDREREGEREGEGGGEVMKKDIEVSSAAQIMTKQGGGQPGKKKAAKRKLNKSDYEAMAAFILG